MKILVTENRQNVESRFHLNIVRVFVDGDYNYGYWVPEDKLYELFSEEQKKQYVSDPSYSGGEFDVTPETAQRIIDIGHTPFEKVKVI